MMSQLLLGWEAALTGMSAMSARNPVREKNLAVFNANTPYLMEDFVNLAYSALCPKSFCEN